MNYKDWESHYKKILKDFDFSMEKDIESAKNLDEFLQCRNELDIDSVKKFIEDAEVVVFGAGPSLEKTICKHIDFLVDKILIAADGTTSALFEKCLLPDIIVTDLDGKIEDQIKANKAGSVLIVHAHGDNIETIKKHFFQLDERIIGSTQTDPSQFKNLYNFGGFTDGDRAIFLAEHFDAKKIYLVGFDFNGEIGKYSFPKGKDKKLKLKKLKWCETFINHLKNKHKNIEHL